MRLNKYLLTEKMTQPKLRSMFKFLPDQIQHKITMDIWHYINTSPGDKVFSGQKSFTDELITRLNLDDFQDWGEELPPNQQKAIEKKLLQAIRKLNLDVQWEWDKKMRAFIKK